MSDMGFRLQNASKAIEQAEQELKKAIAQELERPGRWEVKKSYGILKVRIKAGNLYCQYPVQGFMLLVEDPVVQVQLLLERPS